MKHTHELTLYKHGSQYTMQVEVDMDRIARELLDRTVRNKSHRSRACGGGVTVRMMTKVPVT